MNQGPRPASIVTQTVRERLKAETDALHRTSEQRLQQWAPFDSPAGYERFLRFMLGLYQGFGIAIDESSRLCGLPQRHRTLLADLEEDLRSLNRSHTPIKVSARIEGSRSASGILGIGYVFEGSAMGATVLQRALANRQPQVDAQRFLERLASDAQTRWPSYLSALEAQEIDVAQAVSASQNVFRTILKTLDKGTYQVG